MVQSALGREQFEAVYGKVQAVEKRYMVEGRW